MKTFSQVVLSRIVDIYLPSPLASFFLAAKAFRVTWSMRKCEAFPVPSPRIRHRNELTERDWENAIQGLGKIYTSTLRLSIYSPLFTSRPGDSCILILDVFFNCSGSF